MRPRIRKQAETFAYRLALGPGDTIEGEMGGSAGVPAATGPFATGPGSSGGSGGSSAPSAAGGAPAPSTSGPAGPPAPGGAERKQHIRDVVSPQFEKYHITNPQVQQHMIDQIDQQGTTESGWRDIPQAIQDVNSAKGTPAQGYMQYVPSTFNRAMELNGTPGGNIHNMDDQIRGIIPLEQSEGKIDPNSGFTDSSGSGVGFGHGWG